MEEDGGEGEDKRVPRVEGVKVLREEVIASIHHHGGQRAFSKPLALGLHAPIALQRPHAHTNLHRARLLFTGSSPNSE